MRTNLFRHTCRTAVAVLIAGTAACTGVDAPDPVSLIDASSSSTSSMPPPPPASRALDHRELLLTPQELTLPSSGYSVPEPATADPDGIPGAEVMITSDDSTNAIGITLVLLPDAAAAPQAFAEAVANLTTVRATGTPVSVPVGDQAVSVAGTSPDGTKATTALVFRYDRSLGRIDFYSLPGSPTPAERVIDVGQKQAVALRLGLIALGARS